MKIAYLDLFCGLSGDMTLGALIDAGLPLAELRRGLATLGLRGYSLTARRVLKHAVSATKVDVTIRGRRQVPHGHEHHDHGHARPADHGHGHTSLKEILALIRKSGLPAPVKEAASDCFLRLGRVEGRIHGVDPLKVSFHEVGAVDSIVDIVGSCLGIHLLGVKEVYCSRVPIAHGELETRHGRLPNPGPATMELLEGFPLVPLDLDREILTPTGAALLATFVRDPGRFPDMTLTATGWGAGHWDLPERANVTRLLLGEKASPEHSDTVVLIETNLDNAPGELVGYLFDRLLAAGALDVYTTPIQMKKSRPGVKVSVLAAPATRTAVEEILLRETPTFGVRRTLMERSKLDRSEARVATKYGPIRLKIGRLDGETLKASPEYEDCRAAAEAHGVPLERVAEAARDAWKKGGRKSRR
ncbi:MAG TPA: nickel pincer cofactor biosynthesis protein LarC [Planctomycetota bacterium]|nr:nickel pincer cofactor biosynthesis protein LarC [Planctomycetota bacterium]